MKKVYNGPRSSECYFPPGYETPVELGYKMSLKDMWDTLIYGGKFSLKETPYYKYLEGDKKPMENYLLETKGKTWARAAINEEHLTVQDMFNMFDKVINNDKEYLEPPFEKHYIIVRRDGFLIDGLRRACVLLYNGNDTVPVAILK